MDSFNNKLHIEHDDIKYLKVPVLNVFLGDLPIETKGLFDFRYLQFPEIQLLHLNIAENVVAPEYSFNCGIYSFKSNTFNTLKDIFDSNISELFNEICFNAKQHEYNEKGKLHANLIISSSDEIYQFTEELMNSLFLNLQKAFINGISISIFCIYKEDFQLDTKGNQENLKFVNYVNSVKQKYSKFINGVYFLSNYNNDEIYVREYKEKILFHIFLYFGIKHFSSIHNDYKFSCFSENDFIYFSNYLENDIDTRNTKNCFSIGAMELYIPQNYIKKIIQLCIYKHNKCDADIDSSCTHSYLKINEENVKLVIKSFISDINNVPVKKVKKQFQYFYNNIERINNKYDTDGFKKTISDELSVKIEAFIKSKQNELKESLSLFLLENDLTIFQLVNLLENDVLTSLKQKRKLLSQEYFNQKKELNSFEYTKIKQFEILKGSRIFYRLRYLFLKSLNELTTKKIVLKWKKLYLKQLNSKLLVEVYCKIIDCFENIIKNAKISFKSYEECIDECEKEIVSIASKLDNLQLTNTFDYYYTKTSDVLNNDYLYYNNDDVFEYNSFSEESIKKIICKTICNANGLVERIYCDLVNNNYFDEYENRINNTNEIDAYINILNYIVEKNPINLRIIDSEKVNKKICICFPFDYNISKGFIDVLNLKKEFSNIIYTKSNLSKEVTIFYINGNINVDDLFHL